MVDQAVVQAAEARARRERDVRDLERAQQLRDRVAAPCGDGLRLRTSIARGVVHSRVTYRPLGRIGHPVVRIRRL